MKTQKKNKKHRAQSTNDDNDDRLMRRRAVRRAARAAVGRVARVDASGARRGGDAEGMFGLERAVAGALGGALAAGESDPPVVTVLSDAAADAALRGEARLAGRVACLAAGALPTLRCARTLREPATLVLLIGPFVAHARYVLARTVLGALCDGSDGTG